MLADKSTRLRARHVMAPPYVVKPNNEGSSVGVYLVDEAATSGTAPGGRHNARRGDGRGVCAGARIDDHSDWRRHRRARRADGDGHSDRPAGTTTTPSTSPADRRHVVPADVPVRRFSTLCMDYAMSARIMALGCRGVSRTDFRWDEARGRGRVDPAWKPTRSRA